MAKKMTPSQATAARASLGLDPAPASVTPVAARSPADLTSGPQLEARNIAADLDSGPTLWEETKAAFRVDNSFYRLNSETPDFLIDLNYSSKSFLTENLNRINAMTGADRAEIADELGSANSSEEAEFRLKKMEDDFRDEQTLYDGGISALGVRLLAAIADPIDMTAALFTGGVVGGLVKAGKLGKILTGALSAGVASGTSEALLAKDNVFRDETDVAFATAAGFILGGALNSLSKAENGQLNKVLDDLANDNIDAAAARLGIADDSAGAARRRHVSDGPNKPLKSGDEMLADMEAPTFRYRALNWMLGNLQSRMFYSKSATMRKVASTMFEGGFLTNKKATRSLTVEGRATQLQDVYERGIYAETLKHFKSWSKRNGHGNIARTFTTSVGEKFYSEVGMAMRGITKGISSEAQAAATSIRKQMDGVHKLAQKAGVKGFEADALKDYFPRMLNVNKFTEIRTRIGDDAMAKFYTESIIRGNDEITDSLARKLAKAYVRTMRTKSGGIETDLLHGVRLDDVDKLREVFEGYDGIDEIISEIEAMKLTENAKRGNVSFGKQRITFDESYEDLVTGFDGKTFTLNFTDMLENDARLVLARYGKAMHGHIAMAEKLGVRSRGDFEAFKQRITSDIEEAGGDVGKEIEALEDGYNLILGQPIARWNPGGDTAKLSRTMSGWQYSTRGGQFGVNALAEAGNIIGQGGLRSIFRMFPEFVAVMKRGVSGQLDHKLARFAEMGFAPGISVLTKPAVRTLDELAEGFEGTSWISKLTAKLDPFVKSAGRTTSITSGLGPITDATQRVAAVTWIDKMSRFANGRKMSEGQLSRLRANGVTPEMQDRIFAMLRSQDKGGAGVYRKGRLIDVDIDKWVDDEAYDVFVQAASREVRNVIQLGDVATSTTLFNHPMGRLVFQFMRFPMDAVNKQLARGIYHADAETVMAWTASYGIGAMAYIAQTNIDYANNEEERQKRLTNENIARVAFMRTGMSSMVPAVFDTAITVMGMDPVFALGRSSGLSTAIPLTSNPAHSSIVDFNKGILGIGRSAMWSDTQYSQADVRAAAQLIPGYRTLGIKNVVKVLENQFPESRTQE